MTGLTVSCRRVVHIYRADAGDVVALAGVDLSIGPGEMLALVGPSGSGKSTLVALLSGLMRASAGRVNVGTYDLGKLNEAELARRPAAPRRSGCRAAGTAPCPTAVPCRTCRC